MRWREESGVGRDVRRREEFEVGVRWRVESEGDV